MKVSKTFWRDMTFFTVGIIVVCVFVLGGCASKPEKPVERCPNIEFPKTLIA